MPGRVAAGLIVGLCLAVSGATAQTLTLTRDQALAMARQAYLTGEPALTFAISSKIAAEDPHDVEALLLLSASNGALGRPDAAFIFGKRAWTAAQRAGRPAALRYEVAQQTAHAAWTAGKMRRAAFWLTRALDLAPDAAQPQALANLQRVEAQIKLSFSASLQISPTDNLNSGATTGLLVVQDQVVGSISGWSVAHAGILTFGQVGATYNLGVTRSGKARNSLGFNLSANLHSLTAAEAAANPALDGSDLDMWTARAHWTQERYLDGAVFAGRGPVRMTLAATQNWYAGLPYSPGLRAEIDLPLSPQVQPTQMSLSATVERQWQDGPGGIVDGASLHLRGSRDLALPWGTGQLGFVIGGAVLRGEWSNSVYDSLDASVTLDPGVKAGPVSTRLGLGVTWRDYEVYSLGFANVTKGRTDHGLWLRAEFGLDDVKLAGLTPTLSVMRQMSWSNISKYETAATTLQMGLAADF